MLYYILVRY